MREMASQRALKTERSLFYVVAEIASKFKDSIYLSIGEPDFTTPKHIIDEAKKALDEGYTHYTGDKGALQFRQVIADHLKKTRGIDVSPIDGVEVAVGAAAANFAVFQAFVDPGDEVLLPSPYYPPHEAVTRLVGGVPKFMRLKEELDFMPEPREVERLVTKKTKMMLINSPANPTGGVFDEKCLRALAQIAIRNDMLVLTDECYEKFAYDGIEPKSIISLPGMFERTVLTNSFSKTYAMTGWRIGYAAGPSNLISEVLKMHYNMLVSAPSISQRAAMAALLGPQDCVREMVAEYDRRRKLIVSGLNKIPGISCVMPKGAFYAFPNIKELRMPSVDLAMYLVKEFHVAVTPGSMFGPDGEGHLRISYATAYEKCQEALARIERAVEKLKKT